MRLAKVEQRVQTNNMLSLNKLNRDLRNVANKTSTSLMSTKLCIWRSFDFEIFRVYSLSCTCDLHDSCGENIATYLWDNLWCDIEKMFVLFSLFYLPKSSPLNLPITISITITIVTNSRDWLCKIVEVQSPVSVFQRTQQPFCKLFSIFSIMIFKNNY